VTIAAVSEIIELVNGSARKIRMNQITSAVQNTRSLSNSFVIHDQVKPRQLGCRWNGILLLVPILIVLVLPGFILDFIFRTIGEGDLLGGDRYSVFQALYGFLVVGFAEEISFRGIFQTFMERRFGSQRGIVLTALLFTICHVPSHILGSGLFMGSFSLMFVFYGAMMYGYVWYRTRNIWVISAAHMLNNSTATIMYDLFN